MATDAKGRSAVFLDRDGTLIRERDYLSDPAEVELVPGAVEALALLREAGHAVVVVTNQSGIARGHYGEGDYRAVARRVDEILAEAGVPVDGTYHCPHHPSVTGACECRKPGTGMHRRAARALGLNPARSWYVGDKLSDLLPARTLGGRGILVRTGYGRETEADTAFTRLQEALRREGRKPFPVVDDLLAAARIVADASEPPPA